MIIVSIERQLESQLTEMGEALCDLIASALVARGLNPAMARILAERACKRPVRTQARKTVKEVKTKARKTTSKAKTAYSRAFKEVSGKYKLKSGKWKKGGFRSAVKAAHKLKRRYM